MAEKKVLPQYIHLEDLSTEQLESFLRDDFEMPGRRSDDDIDAILAILAERRENDPSRKKIDTDAAWKAFCKDHLELSDSSDEIKRAETAKTSQQSKPRWRRFAVAAVIAVFLISVTVISPAFGAENIFTVIGRWTDSVFSFHREGTNSQPTDPFDAAGFPSDNADLRQLYAAVSGYIGDAKVVPTWIPEGFVLDNITITPMPNYHAIDAHFINGDTTIAVNIVVMESAGNPASFQYEKDKTAVEELTIDGIGYFFIQNESIWTCVWSNNNLECSIYGELTKDELNHIITSIGGITR